MENGVRIQKGQQNASVGRPTHVHGRPSWSTGTNREQLLSAGRSGGRLLLCHSRSGGRLGHSCARCAHQSTGQSIGSFHRSTGTSPILLHALFLLLLTFGLCTIFLYLLSPYRILPASFFFSPFLFKIKDLSELFIKSFSQSKFRISL